MIGLSRSLRWWNGYPDIALHGVRRANRPGADASRIEQRHARAVEERSSGEHDVHQFIATNAGSPPYVYFKQALTLTYARTVQNHVTPRRDCRPPGDETVTAPEAADQFPAPAPGGRRAATDAPANYSTSRPQPNDDQWGDGRAGQDISTACDHCARNGDGAVADRPDVTPPYWARQHQRPRHGFAGKARTVRTCPVYDGHVISRVWNSERWYAQADGPCPALGWTGDGAGTLTQNSAG